MFIQRLQQKKQTTKLELAPLIDVIFILLLFFAVSSTLVLQNKGIKLELPMAETSVKEKKGIFVSLTKEGTLKLNKETITHTKLQEKIQKLIQETPNIPISFFADRRVTYEHVITTLDHIRLAGGSNIVLEAEKKRDDR